MKDRAPPSDDPYQNLGSSTQSGMRPPPLPQDQRNIARFRIFVHQPRSTRRPFMELLLGLDTWGDTLLVGKVAGEMVLASIVLAIVFLFETAAWSLLFNTIFYGGKFDAGWLSLPATILGTLWGVGIFAIDKSLITADMTKQGGKKWLGFLGRAALIAISALFTAQPMEQLFFRSDIEARLKEETIRTQAVALKSGFDDEAAKREQIETRSLDRDLPPDSGAERKEAEARLDQADLALDGLRRDVNGLELRLARAKSEKSARWAEARRLQAIGAPEYAEAEQQARQQDDKVRQLSASLDTTRAQRGDAEAIAKQAEARLERKEESYHEQLERLGDERKQEADQSTNKLERYRAVLARLHDTPFGERVQGYQGHAVGWNEDGFVERVLVLHHLIDRKPPRWPFGISAEQRAEIASWAGLADLTSGAVRDEERSILMPYLALFFVCALVPLLSIAFKLTMSDELHTYYSLDAQSRAGNPEALAHHQVHARETEW